MSLIDSGFDLENKKPPIDPEIEEINGNLDEIICGIDAHFKNTLTSHEKNFIKAYKG